jgi:hypothetical protein
VPRKRALPVPANGSNLPLMVGAVIYVRVSTKEQTENLSRAVSMDILQFAARVLVVEVPRAC